MRTLITALGFTALLIGGAAAQSTTLAPGLTSSEQTALRQYLPEANLNGINRSQSGALSRIVRYSAYNTRTNVQRAARNVIAERRWVLPSMPGSR